ncbi:MAG: hypothetical protein ACXWCY_16415 [Burkholderiales bacterium]
MAPNTLSSRIYAGLTAFFSVLAVMLTSALVAKRLRWSSVTKRLVSVD